VNTPATPFEVGAGEIIAARSEVVLAIVGTQLSTGTVFAFAARTVTVAEAADLALIPAALCALTLN
jgi:hypothetical protein